MASISIHYTHRETAPKINAEVEALPTCRVLRINETGGDGVTFFFNNDEEVMSFVEGIEQALRAYLINHNEQEGF